MKKVGMAILALVSILQLIVAPTAFALTADVVVKWTPPQYFMGSDGNCNSTTKALGTDASGLQYEFRYTINSGVEQVNVTASPTFTVPAVLVGASVHVKIGGFLPGGTVGCWAEATKVVPVPSVGSCGTITFEIK